MAVAIDQGQGFALFSRPPKCKLPSFTQLDYKMLNFSQHKHAQSSEHDLSFNSIHRSISSPCLSESSLLKDSGSSLRVDILIGHAAPRARALVVEVAMAMASGVNPEPTSSGLGGAYFLRAPNGDTIAVAKPIDEEPLAFNNPKGLVGRMLGQPGMKCSIRIGETGLRESAAYLLDHNGFAGVPPTALVRFSNVRFNMNNSCPDSPPIHKIASLQRYVHHDSDAGDLGPSSFSVTSVHHIGILDIRLMNLDRHAGNILVKRGQENIAGGPAELVPIDHGFCLPESLDGPYFEWLHWPQASLQFSKSEIDYISNLDPVKDAALLRTELPSIGESSIRVLMVCTIFLKRAVASGLCLADIGEMMTREFRGGQEDHSTLEHICINARASLEATLSDNAGMENRHEENDEVMFPFEDESNHKGSDISSTDNPSNLLHPPSIRVVDDDSIFKFTKNGDDNPKVGGMMRSISYQMPSCSYESECISFGDMDNEMWLLFLEKFEELLPEAFDEYKAIGFSRQRLGSSCEF